MRRDPDCRWPDAEGSAWTATGSPSPPQRRRRGAPCAPPGENGTRPGPSGVEPTRRSRGVASSAVDAPGRGTQGEPGTVPAGSAKGGNRGQSVPGATGDEEPVPSAGGGQSLPRARAGALEVEKGKAQVDPQEKE
jgi:hypothetical protein